MTTRHICKMKLDEDADIGRVGEEGTTSSHRPPLHARNDGKELNIDVLATSSSAPRT